MLGQRHLEFKFGLGLRGRISAGGLVVRFVLCRAKPHRSSTFIKAAEFSCSRTSDTMSDYDSPPLSPGSAGSLSSGGLRTPPNLYQNSADPSATWLVQKYGGTSVGKFAVKIAQDIIP